MKNQIVVVLYGKSVEQSITLQYLLQHTAWRTQFQLLIVNNDPSIIIPESTEYKVYNAPENLYLSKAYNLALEQAVNNQARWLLLLDQDTVLTSEYEESVLAAVQEEEQADILFPRVYGEHPDKQQFFLSPVTYHPSIGDTYFSHRQQVPKFCGHQCFKAINSGIVVQVKALQKIGGFPLDFPLDSLDFRFLYLLYTQGATARVLSGRIFQNLSVADLSSMSEARYQSMLHYEFQYVRLLGKLPLFLWRISLIKRAYRVKREAPSKNFETITLSYLFKTI